MMRQQPSDGPLPLEESTDILPEPLLASPDVITGTMMRGDDMDAAPANAHGSSAIVMDPEPRATNSTHIVLGQPDVRDKTEAHPLAAYSAVVTAHFPDRESGIRAREQITGEAMKAYINGIQWFEKTPGEHLWGDPQPGLAAGETALVVHLRDAVHGAAVVHLCEAAGAKHATFYPVQHVVGAPGR